MALAGGAREALREEIHSTDARGVVDDRAERDVEIAGLEQPRVAAPRGGDDLQRDPRRLARDHLEEWWEKQGHEEIGRSDHEATLGRRRIERGAALEEPLGVHEQGVEGADQSFGARGQNHPPTRAHEQRIAEQLAQLRQRMAHRRRRHAHPLGCRRHAALAEQPVERDEQVQVEVRQLEPRHARLSSHCPQFVATNRSLQGFAGVSALCPSPPPHAKAPSAFSIAVVTRSTRRREFHPSPIFGDILETPHEASPDLKQFA